MLSKLERKQKEVERMKVLAARMEMELKIDQLLDSVERIKENIKIQDEAIAKIDALLTNDEENA
jgi:hypothetical protein